MSCYCYNCMELIDDDRICPHCHRDNTPDNIVYRLSAGTVLNDKYLVGNCLGEGGFGITYIGRDLTLDIKVAVKEYYPNGYVNRNNTMSSYVTTSTESQKQVFNKGKDNFLEEARKVAKFLGEPGIVGIRDYFEANGTAYIIMEYLDGVNLASYIKKNGAFDPRTIFKLMLPITYSLKHIHEAGIIHRDISPDNIMYMRSGSLKLMDFGSARYFTSEQKEMSVLLKQGYAPEEQYRKNGKQGPWTDVYALCATIYRCITGNIPEDALDRLRSDGLVPPSRMGVNISPSLESVLLYGLSVFRENRCQSMEELSSLIERALDDPQAVVNTSARPISNAPRMNGVDMARPLNNPQYAQPVTNNPQQPAQRVAQPITNNPQQSAQRVAQPITNRPQQSAQRVAQPITNHPQQPAQRVAQPITNRPQQSAQRVAQPITNHPQQSVSYGAQQSNAAYGVQTATAQKPPKKKKGLVIGIVIGSVALVLAIAIAAFMLMNSSSMDGTYRLVEMVDGGEDMSEGLNSSIIIELIIKGDQGTIDAGSTHYVWTVDKENHTMTDEDNNSMPYRMEGNRLILEDTGRSDRMVFEKQ